MLKMTDVSIQSLVIKLRRAGKKSRRNILNFSGCKTLMRFGPLTF